jgi:thiol-disulfide isomerase/thioredoxin
MNTSILNAVLITAISFSAIAKNYEEITSKEKYQQVLKSADPRIIAFYKKSCGACDQMDPAYDEVAGKFKNKAKFYVLDTEKNQKDFGALIKEHKIEGIPTTIFLKQTEVHRERGCMTKQEIEYAVNHFINGPTGFIVEQPKQAATPETSQATQKMAKK